MSNDRYMKIEDTQFPGLIHCAFKDHYLMTMSFMRQQEFSESAMPGLKGKYFTFELIMDLWADKFGKFDYGTEVVGCNLKGDKFLKFIEIYTDHDDILEKELWAFNLLEDKVRDCLDTHGKCCVIVTMEDDHETIDHELAHGFYYLDFLYKKMMDELTTKLTKKDLDLITKYLEKEAYHPSVHKDEIQAYMATTKIPDLRHRLGGVNASLVREFRKAFKDYKKGL